MYFGNLDIREFLLSMVALVICITIHEFAHAYSAVRAGDDTPRRQGRISLNPIDHLDPMGTIMMVVSSISGFGIGWGKPVQINPYNFRHPRWDNLKVSLWGPLSNVLMAAALGSTLRFWARSMNPNLADFIYETTVVSIALAIFNLIPVTPMDGSHIMSALLPDRQARVYGGFMARNGMFIFLGLIVLGSYILPAVLGPPARFLLRLFIGPW